MFVRKNPWLQSQAAVDQIYDEVVRQTRIDARKADQLAKAIRAIAEVCGSEYSKAQALRAAGHILYARARYPAAIAKYEAAVDLLRRQNRTEELARTLSSAIHALIYLGRYGQAIEWAGEARRILEASGDSLRLARLDANLGNLLYRQDRFAEALALYEKAYGEFSRAGTPQDLAATLSNLAVCHTGLGQFDQALDAYRRARAHCERHGMFVLVAEADYNIAYLHFLRGEYDRAITLYRQARASSIRLRDPYHTALCDLDEAELYLELNMLEEASDLARSAFARFGRLQMRYERAKALAFRAIAAGRAGRPGHALRLFNEARSLFSREKNSVWPAMVDLFRAVVLFESGRPSESRRLCEKALRRFSAAALGSKAAVCQLLLSRLELSSGRFDRAKALAHRAVRWTEEAAVPSLACQAYLILGQALEAAGDDELAVEAYRASHAKLELLRGQLRGQGLRIAFLKDKLAVYESLVWLLLDIDGSPATQPAAFGYIEQAKSRSLADLIAASGQWVPVPRQFPQYLVRAALELQEQINACERQIEMHEMAPSKTSRSSLAILRRQNAECENQLSALLRRADVNDREFANLRGTEAVGADAIRSSLEPGSVLVEYYRARGWFFACVLWRDGLRVVRLCRSDEARQAMRLLQFQLAKFRLGSEYTTRFAGPLLAGANAHLRDLHDLLVAPVREHMRGSHVVFVPHDFLHYLPFHALYDGRRYLVDDFSISSAPSATVYYLCRNRRGAFENRSLVLGMADQYAPNISDEVQRVAARLPSAEVYLNEQATEERLRTLGPGCRFVHIATHGSFRQDNPMLSSLKLGDSDMRLKDIYGLHLPAELLTLSGCGTGLQVVIGGDELVGLVRGFLYAGAHAVLVSLWDVNDRSTAEWMEPFYSALLSDPDKAAAARTAMLSVRERYPHPYYWAPFILIGNPQMAERTTDINAK